MADFTQVQADLWEDPEFEELPAPARLLWLNLLTTPTRNTAGLYHMSIRRMSFETGLEKDAVTSCLGILEGLGWIRWDAATSLVWVRNFVKKQPCGPSLVTKIKTDIEGIGSHPFVDEFRSYYVDTLSTPTRQGIDTQQTPSATCARGDGDGDGTGTGTVRDGDGDGDIGVLVAICREEVQGWEPDAKDPRCIKRGIERLGYADAERIVLELAAYQEEKPPKSRYKNPRLALDKWFAKENPRAKKAAPANGSPPTSAREQLASYPDIKPPGDWR